VGVAMLLVSGYINNPPKQHIHDAASNVWFQQSIAM
jgi:hypothetical protein